MRKRQMLILVISAVLFTCGSTLAQVPKEQAGQKRMIRQMNITGVIAKSGNGYIIRGKVPAEIFTILNPVPDTLDRFVKSEKIVKLEARIVSGDNIEIVKIDGTEYLKSPDSGSK